MAKKRTNYTQLPSTNELKQILEKEAKRPLAKGKENLHYVEFERVIGWLKTIGASRDVFEKDLDWKKIIVAGAKIEPEVVKKTLQIIKERNRQALEILKAVTNYLGEEDKPEKSDLIFVFGSRNLGRIQKAVELWKQDLAPIIFVSGSRPHYQDQEGESEAVVFKNYTIKQGIPEEKIFIEPNSITFADNARRSLNLMDEKEIPYSKMILISAWFSLRRAWSHMMKYVPLRAKVFRVSAPLSEGSQLAPEAWYKNKQGVKVIFNEFVKMRMGVTLNTN